MLRGSHLGHDAIVKDKASISCNVMIGGHSEVGEGANLGLGVVVHQWLHVGSYSMVGMGSVVTKNVHPLMLGYGNPFKHAKLNMVGLKRKGLTEEEISLLEDYARYAKTAHHVCLQSASEIGLNDTAIKLLREYLASGAK